MLIVAAGCGTAKSVNSEKKPNTTMDANKSAYFVSIDSLKGNLNNVVLLDARSEKDYAGGHIPGAINATWQSFANMEGKPGQPNWGTLLSKEKLSEKLGALGIDGKKSVIVYTDHTGWGEDGRIVWMLRMAGIKDSKMLDGGWKAWTAANNAISKDGPAVTPATLAVPSMDDNFNATTEWISGNLDRIKIVDARSPKEYAGAVDFGEARGGHLPKAISIPYEGSFNADGTVKNTEELKNIFDKAGLKPEDEIVTYCTKGIRSAHMALLLRMAGFEKARNYDASFYSWAGDSSLNVEK